MPEGDTNVAAALAQLKEQVANVAASVDAIKISVAQVVVLDRTIAELNIHNQNLRDDVKMLWVRSDAHKDKHDQLKTADDTIDGKVEALSNRARGAMWVLGIMLGTFQAIVLASMAWVFTHVNDADVTNRLQQQRIEQLELQLKDKR
jgi:regulator of replication initiation timing